MDLEFLAVEFLYKRKIGKKIFIGGGLGAGFVLFFSNKGSNVEFLKLKFDVTVQLSKKFYINQELGGAVIFREDRAEIVYKIGASFFYKVGKVELGFKPAIMIPLNKDKSPSFSESFLAIPLISLKIPLKRW